MPESLRGVLRKPLGHVISSLGQLSEAKLNRMNALIQNRGYIGHVSVGDMVTYYLKNHGITPSASIIDGMTLRKALSAEFIDGILVKGYSEAPNRKGTIQSEAVEALYTMFVSGHKRATKQVRIHGEEDLLTLVAVLFAPLGSHIWYGLSEIGAVDVLVTENTKQTVYNLLKQFKSAEMAQA